eukprot:963247-Pleurochrysis_carterae.AAC.1
MLSKSSRTTRFHVQEYCDVLDAVLVKAQKFMAKYTKTSKMHQLPVTLMSIAFHESTFYIHHNCACSQFYDCANPVTIKKTCFALTSRLSTICCNTYKLDIIDEIDHTNRA